MARVIDDRRTIELNNVVNYLRDQKILSLADISDDRLLVTESLSRHKTFRVSWGENPSDGYFLKVAATRHQEHVSAIAMEALAHRLILTDSSTSLLAVPIPKLYRYDRKRSVLTFELV